MIGMADGGENDPPLAVIVSPARRRFLPIGLVFQSIDIFRLKYYVFLLLVVGDVVLLVVDHKVPDALCNWVFFVHHANLEGTQRGVAHVGPAHDIAIILRRKRNMAIIVEGIESTSGLDKLLHRRSLLFGDPGLWLSLRELAPIFEAILVALVC